MQEAYDEFTKYVNNFDLNVESIEFKYNHTFRVVNYAKQIVETITDDERLIHTALIAALLHDLGRFEQFRDYHTFYDRLSYDHGDKAYEILLKDNYIDVYEKDEYLKDVILNAVKYHNKKELVLTDDEFKNTVAKVVRDADKVDILFDPHNLKDEDLIKYEKVKEEEFDINDLIIEDIKKEQLCSNANLKSCFDGILRELAFIFDINYKKSLEILKNGRRVEERFDTLRRFNKKEENLEKINLMEKIMLDYINRKTKEN